MIHGNLFPRYYYYIHNGIDTRYVASINQKWFKRIMQMVPKKLTKSQKEIRKIHDEIKQVRVTLSGPELRPKLN